MYARRACCPEWGKLSERKVSKFFSYFLYFTKSRKKFPKGTSLAACRQRSREAAKDLILPQRSRHCGELIRGLQNLEAFPKGKRFYSFRLYEKNQKYPKGLRPSGLPGTIQISARYVIFAKTTGHHHVTGRAEHCSLSGYRRLGFESVRKESSTLDARLQSFEKGKVYCKLTVVFYG